MCVFCAPHPRGCYRETCDEVVRQGWVSPVLSPLYLLCQKAVITGSSGHNQGCRYSGDVSLLSWSQHLKYEPSDPLMLSPSPLQSVVMIIFMRSAVVTPNPSSPFALCSVTYIRVTSCVSVHFLSILQRAARMAYFCRPTRKLASPWLFFIGFCFSAENKGCGEEKFMILKDFVKIIFTSVIFEV